ncbi:hypothetical protein B0H19DRAFT_942776, partial [Mycena capillaripes]
MVEAFLNEVLCWDSQDRGLFGHTKAYYATVEQQGRLTLHLHSVIWITNALSPQEIRDRILGPKSRFRERLIRYLENSHRAEYFNGSCETVIEKRKVQPLPPDADSDDEIDWSSTYHPPTLTLPKPPPSLCPQTGCTELCAKCRKYSGWWEGFELEVDDLLLRSNGHTHFLSGRKEPEFKIKRERKGCLTKTGVCRARFPREVFTSSEIAEDGHVDVRHIEPMMNTVNPILTFLNRCNTDVTSMLSGTAVKAVVSYVSDYISKLSLKSYQMFASMYDVFEKESEMIGGTARDKDNARHMMRKMVNSMSAKMEIGSPMASLYLLGNPDHYTSHKYVPFAWRSYVQFVRSFWIEDVQNDGADEYGRDDEERIPICRLDGKFVPTSGVDDYRYRPSVYNNLNLFEWIQYHHQAAFEQLQEENLDEDEDNLEDELHDDADDEEEPEIKDNMDEHQDDISDWETDDKDEVILDKQAKLDKSKRPVHHAFMPQHPLFPSHSVTCNLERLTNFIPNFIGGAIPRSDKGDRAAYCMTMLTLFKPWRSPGDLKDNVSTWDQAFTEHTFTDRQRQLIKHFDVRYECNDARDDHYAQMKKKLSEAKKLGQNLFPADFLSYKDKFADDLNDFDYGSDDEDLIDHDDDDERGPKTLRMIVEARDIRQIMETSGWLDAPSDGLPVVDKDHLMLDFKPRVEWASLVKIQRMELTANKLVNIPPAAEGDKSKNVKDGTSILPHNYFNQNSNIDTATNADIVSAIVMCFKLNMEQTRAFRIVSDHA